MRYFIFNINDIEKELDDRLDAKKWPLYPKTKNVENMVKGDLVLFYQAGAGFHVFAGEAVVLGTTLRTKNRHVKFSSAEKWKNKVDIKKIYEELEIIKNPKYYGAYLAGGVLKLSKNDYDLIISKSEK
jgi:hypothetical protein